jgi:hypothetical protein
VVNKSEHGIVVAGKVARGWSDETLQGKKAEDLAKSFGLAIRDAESVLKSELINRGMR